MNPVRIVLAEDHQLVRAGLKLLLSSQRDMQVVAEASSGEETLQKARQFKPDLVIMDLSMPGMNGLKAAEALKGELPAIKILVLTAHEDEAYFRQMCQANASGYILKRSAADELLRAVRRVASGQFHFDEAMATKALTRQSGGATVTNQARARSLSEREEEVLRGVALGYTNKEIASQFSLSIKTIETHKVRICEKLGFRSRADMVQYAVRQGWLNEARSSAQLSA